MNQQQLAEKIALKLNEKRAKIEAFLDAAVELVTESLVKGEKVRLVGFGNFVVRNRKSRIGRNPRTGETMEIPATKCPSFVPGFNLKKAVRKK